VSQAHKQVHKMIIHFLDKIVFDVCAGGTAGGAGWVEEHKYLEFREVENNKVNEVVGNERSCSLNGLVGCEREK
jgi:hypothetical protein